MSNFLKQHPALPGVVRFILPLVILAGLLSYALFQARFLVAGPSIELAQEPPILNEKRVVDIEGVVKNTTALTLNGRPIFTDERGAFYETLVLPNGYTIMTLRARDRYGREVVLERPFVYTSHN